MKQRILFMVIALTLFTVAAPGVLGQGGVKTGPESSTLRDPELEKDSKHNLEVARNYFKLKKAYVAALRRCEEIIAGNPTFARIDEALFIAGSSSLSLAEGKGKQSPSLYVIFDGTNKRTLSSEEFRELGRGYLTQLITDHPQSDYVERANEALRAIGGPRTQMAKP